MDQGSWEPPAQQQLFVSARTVARELGIPIWKANELCWAFERFFYTEGQINYRVLRRDLDYFKGLLEAGVSYNDARTTLRRAVDARARVIERRPVRSRTGVRGWRRRRSW